MKSNIKVGILGAGQLGRMLSQSASRFGQELYFLDAQDDFPAAQISSNFVQGSFNNYDDVLSFGKDLDVISIEIENVNTEALSELEKLGKKVYPQSRVIELIKDKGVQKTFYKEKNIPSSSFSLYDGKASILHDIEQNKISLPFVQKARTGGYDGKGVQVINSIEDLPQLMDTPSVIEDLVDIAKELSVIICRNLHGEIVVYDVVEMVFDPKANLVDYLFSPADINESTRSKCTAIAKSIAESLEIVGILAVELFLSTENEVLVNEMAPRTHNSGHHTIDSTICSQFEQHFRILFDLPLGSTKLKSKGAMVNLIGELGYTGKPFYEGLENIAKIEGVHPHIYGKQLTKPNRKMGHVNIVGSDMEEISEKIKQVKSGIKVKCYE